MVREWGVGVGEGAGVPTVMCTAGFVQELEELLWRNV